MKTVYFYPDLKISQKIRHIFAYILYRLGYNLWSNGYKISQNILEEVQNEKVGEGKCI